MKRLKPLKGHRVLELCSLLPCPMLGLLLSDLGADVLKIEGTEGDPVRNVPPLAFGRGLMYHALNRGKTVRKLDLGKPGDRKQVLELVKDHDILLEGFRPGVLEGMDMGIHVLSAYNPDLLVIRMSALGQNQWTRPAHDLNLVGLSGVLGLNESLDPLPLQAADMSTAMLAAISTLAAIMEGQKGALDVPLVMGAHLAAFPVYARFTGPSDMRTDTRLLEGGYPFYRMYRTRDGRRVSVAAIEPKFVQRIIKITGLQRADQREMEQWFGAYTLQELIDVFSSTPACVEPVLYPWETVKHPVFKTMFAPLTERENTFLLPLTPFAGPEDVPKGTWVKERQS